MCLRRPSVLLHIKTHLSYSFKNVGFKRFYLIEKKKRFYFKVKNCVSLLCKLPTEVCKRSLTAHINLEESYVSQNLYNIALYVQTTPVDQSSRFSYLLSR